MAACLDAVGPDALNGSRSMAELRSRSVRRRHRTGLSWSEYGIVFGQAGKGIMRVSPDRQATAEVIASVDPGMLAGQPQMLARRTRRLVLGEEHRRFVGRRTR